MGTDYKEDQSIKKSKGNITRDKLEIYKDEYKTTY